MGYMNARGMAEAGIDIDTALGWHLQSNHYPPIPSTMIPACKAAIEAYQDEDYQRLIDLPAGVAWKGKRQAPASAIVDGHHLQAFIDAATEEDSE